MTELLRRIKQLIRVAGPIGVADYMAMCLYDPASGYYTTAQPFGIEGDFTTAPEISQMFGELVAVWIYSAWVAGGRPSPAVIAEIGPGRGTLMSDMLRTLSKLDHELVRTARFAMIEASPRLQAVQRQTLVDAPAIPEWHASLLELPAAPLFIIGNELFDAIPIRQFVKSAEGWRERVIGVVGTGEREGDTAELRFMAGAGSVDSALLPPDAASAPEGAIVELAPAREALMDEIASRIARHGGAGLFIDYGYERPAVGDTFQAMRRHRFDDVLAHPGEADLTAHVDFGALAGRGRAAGLDAHLTTQGEFLMGMGLAERAAKLASGAGAAARARIASQAERLAGPNTMGKLFKTLAVFPQGVKIPPFAAD
jgi:SAM-dependent MidA family methyltransferase